MLSQLLIRVRNYFLPGQAKEPAPATASPTRERPAKDDLTVIRGIGAATQQRLYGAGFTTYEKLALAAPADVKRAFSRMAPGQKVEEWIEQARVLVKRP